jgi:hypothetical protein
MEGDAPPRADSAARQKAKTKVAHHVLIELAIVALNARLYGTSGRSPTSVGAQAEPWPPGSFEANTRELVDLRARVSDLTAGYSHLFLLSGEPQVSAGRISNLRSSARPAVVLGIAAVMQSLTGSRNRNQPMVKGRYRWC